MAKQDQLRGFKENVIMGHIIPAGTGFDLHRKLRINPLVELEPEPEVPDFLEEGAAPQPLLG